MPGTRARRSGATQVEAEEVQAVEDVEEEVEQVMEDAEDEEDQEGEKELEFNEPLTWRAGKPISVSELHRRLQALASELRDYEQGEVRQASLHPVAKELATQNLLGHKDRGVRAWTACAIVDMFRLCAPDAPYTQTQLKDIFTLFVTTILPALADPSNSWNAQHLYVLRSLAEVKSVVLLADLPGSSKLLIQMFTTCFDVLSAPSKAVTGEELSKNVEHHMTIVLTALAEESDSLPTEVVDIILAQFLRADPRLAGLSVGKKSGERSEPLAQEAPPSYSMARSVCHGAQERMSKYISTYFSSIMVDSSGGGYQMSHRRSSKRTSSPAESDDEKGNGRTEEDLKEVAKAHRLLRELWRAVPSVLDPIVPHLEVELTTEDIDIRLLATETIGDMISGIGAAGPPPAANLNPSAYPPASLNNEVPRSYKFLTTPTSPLSFPSRHTNTYTSFLQRRVDKSPFIRSAVATALGRILMTSAGGSGLNPEEEKRLLGLYSQLLLDSDERVRLAVVRSLERFEFHDIIHRVGSHGPMSQEGSLLHNLGGRTKDPKPNVRIESTKLIGRLWGVAAGAIADGEGSVKELLGAAPSRILDALYINDPEINTLVARVLHEALLPIAYPPLKAKAAAATNGRSQRSQRDQSQANEALSESKIDKIRAERLLVLLRGLEGKAKNALINRFRTQKKLAIIMERFLKTCEEYNGGVMDTGEKETKTLLSKLIEYYSGTLPEPSKASEALWKFAKTHDRRSYQLIRFAVAPESDYRKVYKSIKEMSKRLEDANQGHVLEVLTPIIYQTALLVYNRSHVPAIIEFSRTDEKGLGSTAHEVLKEISNNNPEVFKAHVQDLCKNLESDAPSAKKDNNASAVQDLKALAGFARRFPKEVPKDRKFVQALIGFALYGSPARAAKHAVTVLLAVSERKELHSKDLATQCLKDFTFGEQHFSARLAAMSQLALLASKETEDETEDMMDVAINQVLLKPATESDTTEDDWFDQPDEVTEAKIWAMKILINRLRSHTDQKSLKDVASPVYKLLNGTIALEGEFKKDMSSPDAHKALMRLTAARLLLKLSTSTKLDPLLSLRSFNQLCTIAQDAHPKVRAGFINNLQKYLAQGKLSSRFYTPMFLLQYEPETTLKNSTVTWLKSKHQQLERQKDTTLELVFARFLSLLAHHPDFSMETQNLLDFVRYIVFYLKTVATRQNLGLIYHIAQRVKNVKDGISDEISENLYTLSDLAQATIREFQDAQGWSLQAWPSRIKLPGGIFLALPSHEASQEISSKQWVPEDVIDELAAVVKDTLKTKKRKSEHAQGDTDRQRKRTKSSNTTASSKSLPIRKPPKTPRPKKQRPATEAPSSDRRRSGRKGGEKSYTELSDDEDDKEMEQWDQAATERSGRRRTDEDDDEGSDLSDVPEDSDEQADHGADSSDVSEDEKAAEGEGEPEEAEPEEAAEEMDEDEPEATPARSRRGAQKTNGTSSTPAKAATPTKSSNSAKASKSQPAKETKASKAKASATTASPAARSTRRSGRNRGAEDEG